MFQYPIKRKPGKKIIACRKFIFNMNTYLDWKFIIDDREPRVMNEMFYVCVNVSVKDAQYAPSAI